MSNECSSAIQSAIDQLFHASGVSLTATTKTGWSLREGLLHVALVGSRSSKNGSSNILLTLIVKHGLPAYLSCCEKKGSSSDGDGDGSLDSRDGSTKPSSRRETNPWLDTSARTQRPLNCFESLCRIVVGQFVSGTSAMAAWSKLLVVTKNAPTPTAILAFATKVDDLQQAVGVTKAKAACLLDLATHFENGNLSEEFLTSTKLNPVNHADSNETHETIVRNALLKVRGIGPWSCDMFVLFYLEHADVLPLGDLAVRKGLTAQLGVRVVSPKEAGHRDLLVYAPYRSLLAYYMYQAVGVTNSSSSDSKKARPQKDEEDANPIASSPTKRRRTSKCRQVTPS